MNKKFLIPSLLVALALVAPVMAVPAANSVTGGGWFIDQWGYRDSFGMNADSNLKGQVEFNGFDQLWLVPFKMHSIAITSFWEDPDPTVSRVIILGTCMVHEYNIFTGAFEWFGPFAFEMRLRDNGEPGINNDRVRLIIPGWVIDTGAPLGYPFGFTLSGGNIQVK